MDVFEERQTIRGEFMPLSILRAVWKQKLLILASWATIVFLGTLVVFQLPAVYQARTVILIEQQRIPERYVDSTVSEGLASRLNRITQQILSYEPLLRLIEEFDLYADVRDEMVQEDVVSMMRDNIDVRLVEGWAKSDAPAFQITFEGDEPGVVTQVTNRLATLFINENLRARANQALGTSEFLTNQLEERRRDVERQDELLRDFRSRHMGELPEQEGVLLAELRRLEAELDRIDAAKVRAEQTKIMHESSLATAQSTLEMLKRIEAERAQKTTIGGVAVTLGGSRGLATEYERAQTRLLDLAARYSDQHPDVVAQRGVVQRLEEMVAQAEAEAEAAAEAAAAAASAEEEEAIAAKAREGENALVSQSVLREMERIEQLRVQLQLVETDMDAYEAARQKAFQEIAAVQAKLNRMPIIEQELKKVVRDYDISNENYRQLLDKRIEADLSSKLENSQKAERFTQLEAARLPEKPIRPDRPMLLAMICGAGLVAGCILGFGVELRRNVILGDWEMPPDVPLLGQVPFIRFDEDLSETESALEGRSPRSFQKKLLIVSTLAVFLVAAAAATSVYFGWISL